MPDTLTPERLRELAGQRSTTLSLFLDLDPERFATPPARETALHSVLDEARRKLDADDGLGHDERTGLREQLEQLRTELRPASLGADGTRAMAIFARADGTDVLRLADSVDNEVALGAGPRLEPLARQVDGVRWVLCLIDRRGARFFVGNEHGWRETGETEGSPFSQHQKGGWSQARYERGIETEANRHFDHVAEILDHALQADRFDRLILGGAEPTRSDFEKRLTPDLQLRLAGWVDADLSNPDLGALRDAGAELIAAYREEHVARAIERLQAGLGAPDGHGAAGLEAVLHALTERRVGELLLDGAFDASAKRCTRCGMLAPERLSACPADGDALVTVPAGGAAMAAALEQDAEVIVLPPRDPRLAPHDGIAAVLRF